VCDSVPESKLITMSLSLLLTSTRPPLLDHSQKPQKNSPFLHIQILEINLPTLTLSSGSGSLHEESGHFPLSPPKPTSLDWYPLQQVFILSMWPLVGFLLASTRLLFPGLWREVQLLIVSLSLGFIMMAMGLTFGLKYSIAL